MLTKDNLCDILQTNIRKAMTERVIHYESSRENGDMVKAVYEDDGRKPFLSCRAESSSKRYRVLALRDRIC